MQVEITDVSFHAVLHGFRGPLRDRPVPEVGQELMDRLWTEVQRLNIKTSGVNHWVYLPNSEMFTGVALIDPAIQEVGNLEPLDVHFGRHLKHVHTGPYSALPKVWPKLFDYLKEIGEHTSLPCLEIYDHWNPDPEKCATTILIPLHDAE